MSLRSWSATAAAFAVLIALPLDTAAHVFAQPYTLPVPFSVYAYAASAALLVSFLVAGLFVAAPKLGAFARPGPPRHIVDADSSWWTHIGRVVSVALLLLCIGTGFAGNQNVFANFNMTFFWIGFVLAVPYAVAIVGDFYAPVNPWRAIVQLAENAAGGPFVGLVRYPQRLGYVPGLLLYMAFIWLELFGQLLPRGLSAALAIYTIINLVGAYVVGTKAWFEFGEFFGIFLRLMGAMSMRARPWGHSASAGDARFAWRPPFVGLLEVPVRDLSLVLFILFMLSSTAFDGLHSTLPWVSLFWKNLYPGIAPWLSDTPAMQFKLSTQIYYGWQWLALLASPCVYLLVYAAAMVVVRRLMRAQLTVRELVLRFATSLVPIAFVYHLTHYYTLLFSQGGQIVRLVSDPFGFGWNLFGTARQAIAPLMLDVGNIWLTQVALILAGHIVGVYLAHLEALRLFTQPRRAAMSQLPMLLLMVAFTNLGLWILSLPIAAS